MKHLKSITGICLTGVLVFQLALPGYAQTTIPEGYDEQTWAQLTDNQFDYDEVEDRIVNFSPTYLSAQYETSKNYAPFETAAGDMEAILRESRDDLKDAKEDGDETMILTLQATIAAGERVKKGLDTTVKTIKGMTARLLNTSVKGALVMNTENLVVSNQRLVAALEVMDASVELAQSSYHSTVTQQSLGMATANEVLAAQQSLLAAQAQQQNIKSQLALLRQSLYQLVGWNHDEQVVISFVPDPDESRIAGMDPQADIEKAIGNNYTLGDLRHNSAQGAAAKRNRLERMEEMETQIAAALNQSYQNVLTCQAAYQASSSAFESAELNYSGAGRQYQQGMLSAIQYQQMTVAYLSQKMSHENAKLDLFQAMESYDWAVRGQLSLE